jgi:hypothetical protein
MALALRGGAFRQGQNKQMDRCGEGTYAAQKTVADSVHEHVVQAFEKLGFEVDVFIAGFPCDTNMHYMQDLAGWFNASAERTDFFHPETDIPEHLNRQGLHPKAHCASCKATSGARKCSTTMFCLPDLIVLSGRTSRSRSSP